MNVRLDEAGQQVRTVGFDYSYAASGGAAFGGHGCGVSGRADRLDAAVANHHIAFDDVEGVVHGEDGGAADD